MNNYGTLIHEQDIKLQRKWFSEMTKLLGINVIFRAPKPSKTYTRYSEIDSNYECPIQVGCIFEEHPTQRTMKKLGWVSELQETPSIISVPYDLKGIQNGALFIVPGGIDNSCGRLFRVTQLYTTMIYPASITCQLVPEYVDEFESALYTHADNSFNLLNEEKEDSKFLY